MFVRASVVVGLLAVLACSADDKREERNPECASDRNIAGECAGLRTLACEGDACASGLSCSSTKSVSADAELSGALAGAPGGTCITLAAGTYGDVALPAGVRLIGRGADAVKVGRITMASSSVVRGLTSAGISLEGATEVRVEDVRIKDAPAEGIRVGSGSSARIVGVEIESAAREALLGIDAKSLDVEQTIVQGGKRGGVWLECSGGCACASETTATLKHVLVRANDVVGMSVVGAKATLDGVEVRDHGVGANFRPAGGVAVSKCANVEATRTRILDNASFGVLVDGAKATLGGNEASRGIEIARNTFGVWVQNTDPLGTQPFVLDNANVHDNGGVGVGVGAFSGLVTIRASEIATTKSASVPTLSNGVPGAREVGDGLTWASEALVKLDGVRLRANARASILIDGSVAKGSSIMRTSLEGGDETKGVLQQHFPNGGIIPEKDDQLPAPQRVANEVYAFPTAPTAPARQGG